MDNETLSMLGSAVSEILQQAAENGTMPLTATKDRVEAILARRRAASEEVQIGGS